MEIFVWNEMVIPLSNPCFLQWHPWSLSVKCMVYDIFRYILKCFEKWITYQYWKKVTNKFEGCVVMSKLGGAADRSGITCALFNVLCGEGGELEASVWVWAKVVIKFLFKCTAS